MDDLRQEYFEDWVRQTHPEADDDLKAMLWSAWNEGATACLQDECRTLRIEIDSLDFQVASLMNSAEEIQDRVERIKNEMPEEDE